MSIVNIFTGISTNGRRFTKNSNTHPSIMCKIIFTPSLRAFASIPIPSIIRIIIIIPSTIKPIEIVLKTSGDL
jgi:hypothetical protein